MKLIVIKTENGKLTGEIAFYCRVLKVSRQGFYNYLEAQTKPWKYEALAAKMYEIIDEDECNDKYGRYRMHKALEFPWKPDTGKRKKRSYKIYLRLLQQDYIRTECNRRFY